MRLIDYYENLNGHKKESFFMMVIDNYYENLNDRRKEKLLQ